MLLGTVVDVAFEASALGIEGVDEASSGHLELVGPRRELAGAPGQLARRRRRRSTRPAWPARPANSRSSTGDKGCSSCSRRRSIPRRSSASATSSVRTCGASALTIRSRCSVSRGQLAASSGRRRPPTTPAPNAHRCPRRAAAPSAAAGRTLVGVLAVTHDRVREAAQCVVGRLTSGAGPACCRGLDPRPHRLEAERHDRRRQDRQAQLGGVGVAEQDAAAEHHEYVRRQRPRRSSLRRRTG